MRVIPVEAGEAERVDAYLEARAAAVTDLPAWRRVVWSAYGMRSYALAALDGERVVGALTLFEVRHRLFGHYLATAPFGNDGGLHFDHPAARDALVGEARALADRLDVEYLVVRTRELELAGFRADRHYRTAVIDLAGGPDVLWKSRLSSKTRNQVRRGMKEGFTVESGPGQVGPFQDVFHEHMRDLGSPGHSQPFYAAILELLGDRAEFFVVRDGSALVAGALLFRLNETASNYHTVALRRYNPRCPNYLIYWKMIEASSAAGCRWLDTGRSESESSNLAFKRNWNPEVLTLVYNYYLRKREELPLVDPRNPRYRLPIAVWRRLPLLVTRALGPRLMPGLV